MLFEILHATGFRVEYLGQACPRTQGYLIVYLQGC